MQFSPSHTQDLGFGKCATHDEIITCILDLKTIGRIYDSFKLF